MYELKEKTKRNISHQFEKRLGVKYEDYEKLDCDEQQKLIAEYHKKNKIK